MEVLRRTTTIRRWDVQRGARGEVWERWVVAQTNMDGAERRFFFFFFALLFF